MNPRYPANPNQIRLNLDFDTIDRLRAETKLRNHKDMSRCAYELLQEALGVRKLPEPVEVAEPEPKPTFDWNAIRADRPR
jgi:hypothetical protein